MPAPEAILLLLVFTVGLRLGSAATNPRDVAALRSLMSQWQIAPPGWGRSDDPCGTPWVGVNCSGSSITSLQLSTMGIKGTLSSNIGQLSELQLLDFSYNPDLGGPLTPRIGNLKKLSTLILAGCSFTGNIPKELGNLTLVSFLALNSNKFTGSIPASLGSLSNLFWFDIADNQLTGTIPVSSGSSPGLDLLVGAKHFHFNKNQLSGSIPAQLFHSGMTLIHVLFDANNFTGQIPETITFVTSLEALRLDRNFLNGSVPSKINNLTRLNELNLANNKLSGLLPDLTGMDNLYYVDLSNNSFGSSPTPAWFGTIVSLTALFIQNGPIQGELPQKLFGFPQLQEVMLENNAINGSLSMGDNISPQLQTVNLQNNKIKSYDKSTSYNNTLMLYGNPVCLEQFQNSFFCQLQQQKAAPYSTSLANCGSNSCPPDQSISPQSCECQYPYGGIMVFRAPFFTDLTNKTLFQELERDLWVSLNSLGLTPGSVLLKNLFFNGDNYLQLQVEIFPTNASYFNSLAITIIGNILSKQLFKPPSMFGPYYFIADPYPFQDTGGRKSSISTATTIGIAVACTILVLGLIVLGIYAFKQKRKAERAAKSSIPFASWGAGTEDAGGAPQLKGARWFSFEELKKSTNNFSEDNEVGSGAYGKVYRGLLPSGQLVAIKRLQKGSMQGGLEFKTEIELLSRVHHRNLVGLVGFCFEHGEQMLVYEYIPTGTLRDSLCGRNGIQLDWIRRLKISMGSARGLAYLHELANPPIIHRDVKTTNILLDENLTAKVADFGLSKLVADAEKGHVSTQVKGTLGYLDPEYYMTQQLTDKSDVYSFGIVMLEMVTAKPPIEKGKHIVREVRMVLRRENDEYDSLKELTDPILLKTGNLIGFRNFLKLALQCVEESSAKRPTMNEVVKEIETIMQSIGANTSSTSTSATEFDKPNGAHKHPYSETFSSQDLRTSDFDYNGGYSHTRKIEPK